MSRWETINSSDRNMFLYSGNSTCKAPSLDGASKSHQYNDCGDKIYRLHDPPSLETISRCISGFIRGTSTLLFVLPEYEAMELINAIYHPGTGHNRPTNSGLCELLSIAAVGSQYEDIGQETQMKLFRSAKWYLDSGFGGGDSLRKMRTLMLVGMFLIFEKSFWARTYIGGFGLFHLWGFPSLIFKYRSSD